MLMLLAVGGATAASGSNAARPMATGLRPDWAPMAKVASQAGLELIDFRRCVGGPSTCGLLAARQPNGEAVVLELSGKRCQGASHCLAGVAVGNQWGGRPGNPDAPGAASRISGKPGKDGAPSDPLHEAQAEATNEIIEALGDGKYDGNYDQFWDDLESIHTWTNPSWIEPDPPPPVEDTIVLSGRGVREPAVLISGRRTNDGAKDCGLWESFTSPTATIEGVGNWIGNAVFDGCQSEVAVFSKSSAALLVKPEGRWSTVADSLSYAVSPTVKVPTTVWVVHADRSFDHEVIELEREFATANDILEESRCGIVIEAGEPIDRTSALADPTQDLGCGKIETILKPRVGFHPNRMNVYVVNRLASKERAGVACTAESENVIMVDQGRNETVLVHEFGHWFDLQHPDGMPLVNVRNIMSPWREMITAGQCYRANFSKDSYINKQGLRSGETRNCKHLQDANNNCPGLKNEF
jgi:hypothetical protein